MSNGMEIRTNRFGVKICYLDSSCCTKGGGTYLSRVLAARVTTNADVFVYVLPHSRNNEETKKRIQKCVNDLILSVKPMILPFKVIVRFGVRFQIDILHNSQFNERRWESFVS